MVPAYAATVDGLADGDWAEAAAFENTPGGCRPGDVLTGWLWERGVDWMPFTDSEICIDLSCGKIPAQDRWRGWYSIKISAATLRRLGLHPDQTTRP
jgi:hypothetical protein